MDYQSVQGLSVDDVPALAEPTPTRQNRRWVEVGMVFAFWTFLALLQILQRTFDPTGVFRGLQWSSVIQALSYFYVWALLTPGIFWVSRRFGIDNVKWGRSAIVHLSVAVVVALFVDVSAGLINLSLGRTWEGFRVLDFRLLDELMVYMAVMAAGFARDYFSRYQSRREETALLQAQAVALRAQLAEARLNALRMQLNPHFLFNTLHAVAALVERDPRGVRRMIARLSALLRYTLDGTAEQEVPLSEELQFLDRYLDIEMIRFQGRLVVQKDIAEDVTDALVPNLILQPLVENAIKHGVNHVDHEGRIGVQASREGERLVLHVTDNGPGLASGDGEADVAEGVGLRNTRARLESLYGNAFSFSLRALPKQGLIAEITLPYHTRADLHTAAALPNPS